MGIRLATSEDDIARFGCHKTHFSHESPQIRRGSKGIFSNFEDDLAGMERVLTARFERFEMEVVVAVALFAGWTAWASGGRVDVFR